jgi:hypothetical protein
MPDDIVLTFLRESPPWGIGLYMVFLLLTRLVDKPNKWSRRSETNGRHESSSADGSSTKSDIP